METTMTTFISGRVTGVKRHGHTVYGNPIMSITLDTDSWGSWHRFSDNAGIVYGIENPEYRDTVHTFTVTKSGRLSGMVRPANISEIAALGAGWNGVQS